MLYWETHLTLMEISGNFGEVANLLLSFGTCITLWDEVILGSFLLSPGNLKYQSEVPIYLIVELVIGANMQTP